MSNQKVNADLYTREKLGISSDTLSEEELRRIQSQANQSNEFRATKEKGSLVIKRIIRD